MKVKLETDRASKYGNVQRAGSILDVPDAEARRMIAKRQATRFKVEQGASPGVETATVQPAENAAGRSKGSRSRG